MTRDSITLQKPAITNKVSAVSMETTEATVTQANGVEVKNAVECENGSMYLLITNSAASDKTITLLRGAKYPNSMLGDLTLTCKTGKLSVVAINDTSRFLDASGSICIDFASGFTGTIAAIGRKIGLS